MSRLLGDSHPNLDPHKIGQNFCTPLLIWFKLNRMYSWLHQKVVNHHIERVQIFLNWFSRVRDCQVVSRSFCHSSEGLVYHHSKVSLKVTTFCSSGPNVYAYIFSLGSLSIPISFPCTCHKTNSTKALGCCMAGMVGDPQMVDVDSCWWNFAPFNHVSMQYQATNKFCGEPGW